MVFREGFACSQNHTRCINYILWAKAEFVDSAAGHSYSYHYAENG
jgi:hypothetical protein